MVQPPTYQVTQLLKQWSGGDNDALEQLTPLVYEELRRLASHHLYGERAGHVMQSCDLVNEAFIRLLDWKDIDWHNRAQFFGILSRLMRHVLVDFAREHNAQRRSGNLKQVSLDNAAVISTDQSAELLALDDALAGLEKFDPLQSQIVEMKFFGGRSVDEIAEALQISTRTVEREWKTAKAWLYTQLLKK